MRSAILTLVSALCFSSCATNGGESEASSERSIASREQAITAESSTAGYRPVPATRLSTGRLRSAWDGPMADLLAADALAQCWSALPESVRRPQTQTYVPSFALATTFADAMVTGLLSKMDSATCTAYRTQGFGPSTATSSVMEAWISARRDPTCSYELSSGQGLGIELAEQRTTMAHAPMPTGVPLAASQDALAEVAYADLYTCMAQKLVEHTQSSFVFIAPAEEVLRLYDWARNRSLLAVVQRSLITRLFSQLLDSSLTASQYNGAMVLRAWLNGLTPERQRIMGEDFASVIDTLVTLLDKQGQMLLRDASREGRRTTKGARARLLRALYGDNVTVPNDITQDMSGIEIGSLLALARGGDLMDLPLQMEAASGALTVDVPRAADALLRAVERVARAQTCARGDLSAPCAQVSASERVEDFKIRERFGIRPQHAETLLRALAESLFGEPEADTAAGSWRTRVARLTESADDDPRISQVGAGDGHACALYESGQVACWGLNQMWQLGGDTTTGEKCGTYPCSTKPVWIRLANGQIMDQVASIAVGAYHTCATRRDGTVLCWGDSIGRGGPYQQYASAPSGLPVDPRSSPRVFAGGRTSCADVQDPDAAFGRRALYCWGFSPNGQVGDGTRGGSCTTNTDCGPSNTCTNGTCGVAIVGQARKVRSGGSGYVVGMGWDHVCATENYETWCWGRADAGQLGRLAGSDETCSSSVACRTRPTKLLDPLGYGFAPPDRGVEFAFLSNVIELYAGGRRTCALTGRGLLKCWGELSAISTNEASDASCGTTACRRTPTTVTMTGGAVLPPLNSASLGWSTACARGPSGHYCWGSNYNGEFGNGNTTSLSMASLVGASDLQRLAEGSSFACGLSADGRSVKCAGANNYGQLGNGTTTNSSSFGGVFSPPPLSTGPAISTPSEAVTAAIRAHRPGFLLVGAEIRAGANAGQVTLHIPPDAAFGSYTGEELQVGALLRQLPLADAQLYQPLAAHGFMHRRFLPNEAGFRDGMSGFEWGGVQALAVARDALRSPPKSLGPWADGALELINQSIGPRAVIVRQDQERRVRLCRPWSSGPRETLDGLCLEPAAAKPSVSGYGQFLVSFFDSKSAEGNLRYTSRIDHPLEFGLAPWKRSFSEPFPPHTVARYSVAESGVKQMKLYALEYASSIFVESGDLSQTKNSYQGVFDGVFPYATYEDPYAFLTGAIATYGGSLNGLATQAFAFDRSDWSKPQYDAFGLPTDWVPTADPALTGSGGEEPYQYYLRLAKETATQATQAINDAFETTRQEETDTAVLEAANERAATLRKQETELLCGKATCAPLVWEKHKILEGIDTKCTTAESLGNALGCAFQMLALQWALSRDVYIPKVVWDQRTAQVPYFKDYAGGEITQSLIGMWTALRRARVSAAATVLAINKGIAEYEVADAEVRAANAAVESARVAARQQYASMQAQIAQMDQQIDELSARRLAAQQTKDRACSDAAYQGAFESGKSYGDVWSMRRNGDSASWKYDNDNDSFSPGPLVTQRETCKRATYELTAANSTADKENLDRLEGALSGLKNAAGPSSPDKTAPVKEAVLRAKVASERVDVQVVSIREAFTNNLNLVLDALGSFGASAAELGRSQKRAEVASARYELDRKLDSKEVAVRQGLRRRYQGLSQWRATAMAENARRTAVAARRAIESRLVVNLSAMGAEEPFVAPPSAWADDVYERDLKPPAAVGVTVSSPQGNGDTQYASKLIDYVNNLELFVAGYSIKRPTAVARNDAEVVNVVGPASVGHTELGDASFFFSDPDSSGWQLYCADTGTYVVNPLTNKFGSLDYNALRTACGGKPPSRAVIRFWLDPWGQLMGNPYSEPFKARYNTRWKQFAVNLVGTGIRDCASAAVPVDCYSEPFLRYDLKHVGPAVVTDYEKGWRSLKIPNAIVQRAKALAIEEWVDSVSRAWNVPDVQAVARGELLGRPMGGTYELSFELTPDVRLERIERVQILTAVDYWTRQE